MTLLEGLSDRGTSPRPRAPTPRSVQDDEGGYAHAAQWDDYATRIAARKKAPEWAVLREARASHYHEFFHIQPNAKVLDAGCGHGDYTVLALKDGARVWAIDYCETMIACTHQAIREEGLRAEDVARQSVTDIGYPDNTFDVVMNLSVLEGLTDREGALRELVRVLRPGGQLYIDVCNALSVHWHACFRAMQFLGIRPAGKMHYFTPRELKAMVRRAGCRPDSSSGTHSCPPFTGFYTTDLRRFTILPAFMIRPLDRLYLAVERRACRSWPTRLFCWHYVLRAIKLAEGFVGSEHCERQ
ncbi:MAG: class I SAM-dependent methyltransferase [Phycisphaerae bacterium]|nr:class I SAM-dependent methyltransferase [Phycisphaerae bacterium]